MTAESMMPLPPDVVGVAEQAAIDIETAGKWIASTQVAADTASGVPGWSGQAADAYTESVQTLGAKARDWAETFAEPAKAMRSWADAVAVMRNTTVPGHWERHDQAQNDYVKASML